MSTAIASRAGLDACSHLASPSCIGVSRSLGCAASHVRSHSVPTLSPTLVCSPCDISGVAPSHMEESQMGDSSPSGGARARARAVAAALSCLCMSTSSPPRRPRTSSFSVGAAFSAAARLRVRSRNRTCRTCRRCPCRKRAEFSACKSCRMSSSSSCVVVEADVRNIDRDDDQVCVMDVEGDANVIIDVVDDLPSSSTSSETTLSPLLHSKINHLTQPSITPAPLSPPPTNLTHDLSAFAETVSDVASSGSVSPSFSPFGVGVGEGNGMLKLLDSDDDLELDQKDNVCCDDDRNRFINQLDRGEKESFASIKKGEDDDDNEMFYSSGAGLEAFRDDTDAPDDLDDLFDECDNDALNDSWAPTPSEPIDDGEDPFSAAALMPAEAPVHCDLSMFSVGSALEAEWRADGDDHNRRAGLTDISPPTDIRTLVPLFLQQYHSRSNDKG